MSRFGKKIALEGAEAVKGLYREWTHTDQCEVYAADCEELAVSDSMVVSSATLYQQTPGSILAAEGVPVDSDATYLMKAVQYMIWPYDKGRLVGEDVWEYDEASREHNPYTA